MKRPTTASIFASKLAPGPQPWARAPIRRRRLFHRESFDPELESRGKGATFDQIDNFRIEDRMFHTLDDAAVGPIQGVAAQWFVTAPGTGSSDEIYTRAIAAASAGDTITVEAGVYPEPVDVNKPITLAGVATIGLYASDVSICFLRNTNTLGDRQLGDVAREAQARWMELMSGTLSGGIRRMPGKTECDLMLGGRT